MAYLPHTPTDRAAMLQQIGVGTIAELFADIPSAARLTRPLALPPSLSELELQQHLAEMAAANSTVGELACFLGTGFYDRFIPQAVGALIGRGEFLTAYTPYQPELSQGTLAAIFEFQSMIAGLTGMDVAQASMYDGASAVAEAGLMALAQKRSRRVVVSDGVYPDSLTVLSTYLAARGGEVVMVNGLEALDRTLAAQPGAAVIWQYPDVLGRFAGLADVIESAHRHDALAIVAVDPVALAVLVPPGELGADVVVGEGQPLGNRLNLGGPTFGFFAVRSELVRRIPGRLVGAAHDAQGRRGFVLTLQAREQHIRRDKATSNICSNHSLNALAATIYLSLLGPSGLAQTATLSAQKAHYLQAGLAARGLELAFPEEPFLYEFTVRVNDSVEELNQYLLEHGILGGYHLGRLRPEWQGLWQLAVTEKRRRQELDHVLGEVEQWMSR